MLLAVGRRDAEELASASADGEKGDYGNGDVSDVTVKDKPRHVELRELLWHVRGTAGAGRGVWAVSYIHLTLPTRSTV